MFNFVNKFFFSFILVSSVALSACGPVGNLMNQSESNVGEAGLMPSKKPSAEAGSFAPESFAGKYADFLFPSSFNCTKTFTDGRSIKTRTCGGESEAEICCGLDQYETNADSCVLSCECLYSEERRGSNKVVDAQYSNMIRGVPVFDQFDAEGWWTFQPIGCGPIAVTQLALWYHGWGFTGLGNPYKNSRGEIRWKDLAYDAADSLDTWIRINASPTLPGKMLRGMTDLFADLGYDASVNHVEVSDAGSEEASSFAQIRTNILQGRPVVIGFDIDAEEGGGIGGGGDDVGFIDHYGLIVGYDDRDGVEEIHINMGWGGDYGDEGTKTYEWKVGTGKVHLWFVQMKAREKTMGTDGRPVEECPSDDPYGMFAPNSIIDSNGDRSYIGATFEENRSPVQRELLRETSCELLGGDVTHLEYYDYTYEWSDDYSCHERYSRYDDVASGDWDPGFESGPDMPF